MPMLPKQKIILWKINLPDAPTFSRQKAATSVMIVARRPGVFPGRVGSRDERDEDRRRSRRRDRSRFSATRAMFRTSAAEKFRPAMSESD
jgi:hypothetical protein